MSQPTLQLLAGEKPADSRAALRELYTKYGGSVYGRCHYLLGKLDLETQQAAVHYFVDEMTLEEVAAAIGRSIPTVRKRLAGIAALAGRDLNEEAPEHARG